MLFKTTSKVIGNYYCCLPLITDDKQTIFFPTAFFPNDNNRYIEKCFYTHLNLYFQQQKPNFLLPHPVQSLGLLPVVYN